MGKSTQKSQNTEACRDLSGRRMRDVSTEKKYVVENEVVYKSGHDLSIQ